MNEMFTVLMNGAHLSEGSLVFIRNSVLKSWNSNI